MITASIVLYKTPKHQINDVLNSVLNSNNIYKLFIIDNYTTDENRVFFKTCSLNKIIEYIPHENTGYGASHNIAIRKAIEMNSDYHVVLNPDIRFDPDVLKSLYNYMEEHKEIGHVMPKIVNESGEIQYLCKLLPSPFDLIFKRFLPKTITKKATYKFQLRFSDYDKEMDVPYLSGCFMFFRTSALTEVNGFDERFFMYPEDIDITRRIHRNWRTVYYPRVFVYHLHAAESYHSKKMLLIHIQNMIKYFNKWGWFFDNERKKFNKETLQKLNYKSIRKGDK